MSRLATFFVLGYHGCDHAVAWRAIAGEIDLLHSDTAYDWLGPGAYFCESDPRRAFEWAEDGVRRGRLTIPAVVGAVIELRKCLDLSNREDLALVREAHRSFVRLQGEAGLSVPRNSPIKGHRRADRHLRYLDCAVIRHLHDIIAAENDAERLPAYDTVRGPFFEGGRLFPGSGIAKQNHVQIAVRSNACIKGIFLPRPHPYSPGATGSP